MLVARSSSSSTIADSVVPSYGSRCGGSVLQCEYCGNEGHVEAYCFWKKKENAHARQSSLGVVGSSPGGSHMSFSRLNT